MLGVRDFLEEVAPIRFKFGNERVEFILVHLFLSFSFHCQRPTAGVCRVVRPEEEGSYKRFDATAGPSHGER